MDQTANILAAVLSYQQHNQNLPTAAIVPSADLQATVDGGHVVKYGNEYQIKVPAYGSVKGFNLTLKPGKTTSVKLITPKG